MLSGSDGKKDDCSFMTRQSHRSVCSASDFFTNSQSIIAQRAHDLRNRMHQKCTYGSVGAPGGQPPGATWPQTFSVPRSSFLGLPRGSICEREKGKAPKRDMPTRQRETGYFFIETAKGR